MGPMMCPKKGSGVYPQGRERKPRLQTMAARPGSTGTSAGVPFGGVSLSLSLSLSLPLSHFTSIRTLQLIAFKKIEITKKRK